MPTAVSEPVLIYDLFPRLIGPVSQWGPHLERARELGFTWVSLGPLHQPGASGSLYSVRDFAQLNPVLVDPTAQETPREQLRRGVAKAHDLGLRVMADLIVSQVAVDAPLVGERPDWFRRHDDGRHVHPGVREGGRVLKEWSDVVVVANAETADREGLWSHWRDVVGDLLELGLDGLRAHRAYEAPAALWDELLAHARSLRGDLLLVADTVGCPDWQVVEVARLDFDLCVNSSKWWDFSRSWCLDQYRATAPHAGTISFPESQDTPRLVEELRGNGAAVRQRYVFAGLFSAAVQAPVGFELGFRRPLDAATTTPSDWEPVHDDLRELVAAVNALKQRYRVFREDNPIDRISQPDPAVVVLRKRAHDGGQSGLLVFNVDRHRAARVLLGDLARILESTQVVEARFDGGEPVRVGQVSGTLPPSGYRAFVGE